MSNGFRVTLSVLLALIGLAAAVPGIWMVSEQHRLNSTCVPVDVKINTSQVEARKTSKGKTRYVAVVRYSYFVDGRGYSGANLIASSVGGPSLGTGEVVAKFPVGTQVKAFRDPGKPWASFLIREYVFDPYFIALIGFALLSFAAGVWFAPQRRNDAGGLTPQEGTSEWFRLTPKQSPQRSVARWGWVAFVLLISTSVPAHYFGIVHAAASTPAWIAVGFLAAALCVTSLLWWRARSNFRRFAEPIVLANASTLQAGRPFRMRLAIGIVRPFQDGELIVSTRCMELTRKMVGAKPVESVTCLEQAVTLQCPTEPATELISEEWETAINPRLPASSDPAKRGKVYPHISWFVRVVVKVRGGFDLSLDYPIMVVGSAEPDAAD